MPRAVNRRMSAPHGHAGQRRLAAELVAQGAADGLDPRMVRRRLARARTRRPPRRARRAPRRRRARASTTACSAARAASRSAPTGTPSRPSNSTPVGDLARPVAAAHAADEQRVGQLELAHQRVRDVRVDRELVLGEREVDARRSGRSPSSRRAARRRGRSGRATTPLEGQRARLGADDAQAGRLGQQRGVEGGVALERRERAEPAVLLGGDGLQHDLGRRRRPRAAARRARAARRSPRPSCRPTPRPCRRPPSIAPDERIARPGLGAGPDDVDVAVERDPPGRACRAASRSRPTARRARPPPPGGRGGRAGRRGRARAGRPSSPAASARSATSSSARRARRR